MHPKNWKIWTKNEGSPYIKCANSTIPFDTVKFVMSFFNAIFWNPLFCEILLRPLVVYLFDCVLQEEICSLPPPLLSVNPLNLQVRWKLILILFKRFSPSHFFDSPCIFYLNNFNSLSNFCNGLPALGNINFSHSQ